MSTINNCPLTPFPGRCVVEREGYKEVSKLIYTPDRYKSLPTLGTIVAVNDADAQDWPDMIGKRVLFARMSGVPVTLKNQPKYDIFAYSELLCEVPKELGELTMELEDNQPL